MKEEAQQCQGIPMSVKDKNNVLHPYPLLHRYSWIPNFSQLEDANGI
jgi:hypothetical protein